ncbi:uncharacterized protein LOC135478108 [Liolophura sinensis]|uniref:uncharacterized protein LOC135478108 n=1 Tax=Liolophura sinensis TaxID=3198878 RepID=UPI0031593128
MFQVHESGNLQCFESKVLPTKPSAYLKICFQVVQGKEQMARECQKLHSFLLRVKMFNPQDNISFHLHLFGIYCDHTDICSDVEYLTDPVCEKEMPPALVITPSYFLRNKEVPCSPVHVKHGVCVPLKHLAQTDFASPKLQATAILVPHRQRAQDQSHGFINLMFTYSGYIPVGSTSIPSWKPDVVGDIFHSCECQNCENPGPFQSPIQLHVVCTEHNFIMQRNSYVIYVVLDIKNDEHISQESINKLCEPKIVLSYEVDYTWFQRFWETHVIINLW